MSNLLVLVGWSLLALVVFDRTDLFRFMSSAVQFVAENKEAVLITLAVLVALKIISRAPQVRGH
jgi:hypothetical protein